MAKNPLVPLHPPWSENCRRYAPGAFGRQIFQARGLKFNLFQKILFPNFLTVTVTFGHRAPPLFLKMQTKSVLYRRMFRVNSTIITPKLSVGFKAT